MSSRVSRRIREVRERHPHLATAARGSVTVVGLCTLLVAVAVLVGFVLGAPGPTATEPTVNFDAAPAAVVADASAHLDYHNHTVQWWVRTVDRRTGSVSGGLYYRMHVEPTRGHVRGRLQHVAISGPDDVLGDRPAAELFATRGAAWVRLKDSEYWQRSRAGAQLATDVHEITNASRSRLADATLTVVADNQTSYVVETTDPSAAGFEGGGTVRYVVAKEPEPHLRQLRYDASGPTERETQLFRVVDDDEVVAARPLALPPTTVSEMLARVERGWSRLF